MALRAVPGLTRVAQVFSPTEAALLVSALEGAGFKVFVPGFHTLSNLQYLSVALGGIPVMVATSRAPEALAFLDALETGGVSLLDQHHTGPADHSSLPPAKRGLLRRFLTSCFYLATGTAPALPGRYMAHKNTPR